VKVAEPAELDAVVRATARFASNAPALDRDRSTVTVPVHEGTRLMEVMRALDDEHVDAIDLNRRQASLDDVFLTLTGAPRPDEEVSA
jgi:hypothetical protein